MSSPQYRSLAEEAFEANREIPKRNLAILTWGNASAADQGLGVFAIKPSGVPYESLSPESMVLVDFEGRTVEGSLRPSSDAPTHALLYRSWSGLHGVVHTHSPFATAWAQACSPLPIYGTTHADHATTSIPCTPYLSPEAVKGDYEVETGGLIVSTFAKLGLDPEETKMVLVAGHGPFTWGGSADEALRNAVILEELCKMGLFTKLLAPGQPPLPPHIVEKHWRRKHGPDAYYGQPAR